MTDLPSGRNVEEKKQPEGKIVAMEIIKLFDKHKIPLVHAICIIGGVKVHLEGVFQERINKLAPNPLVG